MATSSYARTLPTGEALLAASRQVWLAGLGAAVVSREWAHNEAGQVFRTLVREGTAIEARTFRIVGDGIETGFTRANALWRRTRDTVTGTVKAYAETATTLVRETLPRNLPKLDLPATLRRVMPPKAKAARAKRAVKSRTTRAKTAAPRPVKRAKKRATKRA